MVDQITKRICLGEKKSRLLWWQQIQRSSYFYCERKDRRGSKLHGDIYQLKDLRLTGLASQGNTAAFYIYILLDTFSVPESRIYTFLNELLYADRFFFTLHVFQRPVEPFTALFFNISSLK